MSKITDKDIEYLLTPQAELDKRDKNNLAEKQAMIGWIAQGLVWTSITDTLGGYD